MVINTINIECRSLIAAIDSCTWFEPWIRKKKFMVTVTWSIILWKLKKKKGVVFTDFHFHIGTRPKKKFLPAALLYALLVRALSWERLLLAIQL